MLMVTADLTTTKGFCGSKDLANAGLKNMHLLSLLRTDDANEQCVCPKMAESTAEFSKVLFFGTICFPRVLCWTSVQ